MRKTFHAILLIAAGLVQAKGAERWVQSYDAGYTDANGAWAGGSEMMHLASHKGKLYASNGYWVDSHWVIPPEGQRQSAQVLRLDSSDAQWQVDLKMGKSNDDLGLEYMKGNILKSVTFTRDAKGQPLAKPESLLVMAAGANFERGGAVSAWVRDDSTDKWTHTLVRHGSSAGGVRWVPRDMEVYRDKVTGVERIFMSLGNPGIISGVYDPAAPGRIRWDRNLEYPFLTDGSFRTRPLGITKANGSLFFSEGDSIYQRIDGERPTYREIFELFEDTDTDVGGIRGLTRVNNPNGKGDSLLFIWAPGERSASAVKRLDPDGKGGYTLHDEARIIDLMEDYLDVEVTYTLGAHNMVYPFTDPATGETVHIIGFRGTFAGPKTISAGKAARSMPARSMQCDGPIRAIKFSKSTTATNPASNSSFLPALFASHHSATRTSISQDMIPASRTPTTWPGFSAHPSRSFSDQRKPAMLSRPSPNQSPRNAYWMDQFTSSASTPPTKTGSIIWKNASASTPTASSRNVASNPSDTGFPPKARPKNVVV